MSLIPAKLLRQTVLERAEEPLDPPPGLWRIGGDVLDAELRERPRPDPMCRPLLVDLAAGLRRHEVMAPRGRCRRLQNRSIVSPRKLECVLSSSTRKAEFLLATRSSSRSNAASQRKGEASWNTSMPGSGRLGYAAGGAPRGASPASPDPPAEAEGTVGEAMIAHQVLVKVTSSCPVPIARPVCSSSHSIWSTGARRPEARPRRRSIRPSAPSASVTIPKPAKVTVAHPGPPPQLNRPLPYRPIAF